MEMTIKDYCDKKGMKPRYIQQLIKEGLSDLLKEKWGINSVIKYGNTYVLNVNEKHITNDKNKYV